MKKSITLFIFVLTLSVAGTSFAKKSVSIDGLSCTAVGDGYSAAVQGTYINANGDGCPFSSTLVLNTDTKVKCDNKTINLELVEEKGNYSVSVNNYTADVPCPEKINLKANYIEKNDGSDDYLK